MQEIEDKDKGNGYGFSCAGHVQYTNWQLCIQTTKPHSIVAIESNPAQISELDNS